MIFCCSALTSSSPLAFFLKIGRPCDLFVLVCYFASSLVTLSKCPAQRALETA
jgi:hypothetical protein